MPDLQAISIYRIAQEISKKLAELSHTVTWEAKSLLEGVQLVLQKLPDRSSNQKVQGIANEF